MRDYYKKASDWMLEGKKSLSVSAFTPVAPAISATVYDFTSMQTGFTVERPLKVFFIGIGVTTGIDLIGTRTNQFLAGQSAIASQLRSAISRRAAISSQAIENALANGTSLPSNSNKRLHCPSAFAGYALHLIAGYSINIAVAGTQIDILCGFTHQGIVFSYPSGFQTDTQITQTIAGASATVGLFYVVLPNPMAEAYRRRYAQAYVFLLTNRVSSANDFLSEAYQNGNVDAQLDIQQIGIENLRIHIIRYYMIERGERGNELNSDRSIVTIQDERLLLNNHAYQQELINRISQNLLQRPNQHVREGWCDNSLPSSIAESRRQRQ